MSFSYDDMAKFAAEAWGPLGAQTVKVWALYNERFFGGVLKPVPLVITNAQPFGGRLAFCSHNTAGGGRTITVNVPSAHSQLLADNSTLLHEMIHQCLFERGENPKHSSEAWRREIMRLHHVLTGAEIWAGKSRPVRRDGRVIRENQPHPDGRLSLPQGEIARWRTALELSLARLAVTRSRVLHVLSDVRDVCSGWGVLVDTPNHPNIRTSAKPNTNRTYPNNPYI
jgi:hypothetical protein